MPRVTVRGRSAAAIVIHDGHTIHRQNFLGDFEDTGPHNRAPHHCPTQYPVPKSGGPVTYRRRTMPTELLPSALNRTLCPLLRGEVHFDLSKANAQAVRGLVVDEEVCHAQVNVLGLVASTFDQRNPSYKEPWAESARARFNKLCIARFEKSAQGCMHALAASASCGPHAECTSARAFMIDLVDADHHAAWGRRLDTASDTVPTLELLKQRHAGMALPSMAAQQIWIQQKVSPAEERRPNPAEAAFRRALREAQDASYRYTADGTAEMVPPPVPIVPAASAPPSLPPVPVADRDDAVANDRAMPSDERPSVACSVLLEDAIKQSTGTMEDFILVQRRGSPTAAKSLRALYSAIASCTSSSSAPPSTLAKSWYRLGFLLNRHGGLVKAASLALEHAITLNPDTAGPPNAELMLLKLAELESEHVRNDVKDLKLEIKTRYTEARRLNPSLASHLFTKQYSTSSLLEVLERIDERRAARDGVDARDLARQMPSDIERCVEAQSMRDMHRLRGRHGDVERADALDRILHELVIKGTKVPKAPYACD